MAGVVGILGGSKLNMRPLMIILAAVALGLIFLGIVLTIVGYWPGYTAWGGNPLKYVGPIMLGIGIIILVGVIADCCVRQEKDEKRDYAERKEFVDFSSKSGTTPAPSVTVSQQYETEAKKYSPPKSAFRPINADNGYSSEVNVLTMLKDSPTRDRKYGNNYNQTNIIPTPTYPSETGKKSVGYNAYTYSSDGDKAKLASAQINKPAPYRQKSYEQMQYEQGPKSAAPYRQQQMQPIQAEGPRKWGSTERVIDGSGGPTPPRSPKSQKNKGDPNKGIKLQKSSGPGEKYNVPTLNMPNFGRKTKDKSDKSASRENSVPGSPDKVRRAHSVESKNKQNEQPDSPTWGGHRKKKKVPTATLR